MNDHTHDKNDIGSVRASRNIPLRVLIIETNQALLDSLARWLLWTQPQVEIVGKMSTAISVLEDWKLTQPQVIVLSIPREDLAAIAIASTALAIKALYPRTKIVALAWKWSDPGQGKWDPFARIADAWIFKDSILDDFLPRLTELFPENFQAQ